ncbi:MAG: amidase family protein [Nevskiales bacterium]
MPVNPRFAVLPRASAAGLLLACAVGATLPPAQADSQPPPFKLEEASVAQIDAALASGRITSVKLVQMYLDRIAAYNEQGPKLHSVLTINPAALKLAAQLDQERAAHGPRGPLHGIPVLLKDNVDTDDMPTSNGSAILKNSIPSTDAFLAQRLRDAGAIILGKTAMGEFAGGSYNSVGGQTINPYNLKRHTGGSSSGSAASIASNFAVLAIGTDTSTSVRGPSSYNGIVGLRPTTGLISRAGIAPKNLNFDSAGPMARSVADVALMLGTVAGPDPADPLSQKVWSEESKHYKTHGNRIDYTRFLDAQALKGKKIGVVRTFFGGDPEIDALAEAALAKMREQGATTVDIQLDPAFVDAYLGEGNRKIRKVSDYRFKADWEAYLASLGPDVPKSVADFIHLYETQVNHSPLPVEDSVMRLLKDSTTTSTDDPAYQDLVTKVLPKATAGKLAIFAKYHVDALVFPYFSSFAAPISNPVYSIEDPTFVKSTRPEPATLAGYGSVGFPCLVVPMGFGTQGLPMDIAFFGKPYEEGKLIGMGYAYEQASKMRRAPPLLPALASESQ